MSEDKKSLTLPAFEEAYEDVKKVTLETKLIFSDYWSGITGNKVYLKPENLQRTGAYKVRGAYYKISTMSEDERKKGLITASAGNHAQGVAYAAQKYGVKATIVDLGNRFRLITSEVECIEPKPMPKLPVASALWVPQPTFEIGAGAWILAGGTHHSAFSYEITAEYWEDFAEITGIEFVNIDKDTTISKFKQQLRNNEVYFMLNKALQ